MALGPGQTCGEGKGRGWGCRRGCAQRGGLLPSYTARISPPPPVSNRSTLHVLAHYTMTCISCSYKSVEQRPRQHVATQPTEDFTSPEVAEWSVEVFGRLALHPKCEDERRYDQGAHEVEDEAWIRL